MESSEGAQGRSLSSRAATLARLALGTGIVVVVVEAGLSVLFAGPLYDEGGYLYEGWAVCARGWHPYRDFHTKLPPLIYYYYGLPQAVAGPSLLLGRVQAAATSLAALGLAAAAAWRCYGIWAGAAVVWCFAAALAGLDQHFRALAVPPATLFISAGLLAVAWSRSRWSPLAGGAAVGLLLLARHDLLGAAAAIVLGIGIARRSIRAACTALVVAVLVFAAGIAPFAIAQPIEVGRVLSFGLLGPRLNLGPAPFERTELVSLGNLPWYAMFLTRAYVTALLFLLPGLAAALSSNCRALAARHPLITSALAVAIFNILVRGTGAAVLGRNAFYLRDFYVEIALATAAGATVAQGWMRAGEPRHRSLIAVLALVAILLGPAAVGLPDAIVPRRPTLIESVADAGKFIASHTSPTDRVFSIADPYIFLAARRELLPRLTHHVFKYYPNASTDDVLASRGYNLDLLMQMLSREATVAVISARMMDWVVDNERTKAGGPLARAIEDELRRNWTLVAETDNAFVQHLSIYRPNK